MIETALIDGDLVAHRVAAATENEPEDIATWRTSELMNRLLHETNAMAHRCFLTGSNNFRYDIYPDYKANRKDMPKPKWLQAVREHLVTVWNSTVTDGIEADDAMGIEQVASEDTIIVSLDKDMLMVPGQHYSWEISGTSVLGKEWTRPAEFRNVSPLDGVRHHCYQILMGDRSDNIPGFDGKMRNTVPKFMQPLIDGLYECHEDELYKYVAEVHHNPEMLPVYARCLWIMRKEGEEWVYPVDGVDRGTEEEFHNFGVAGSV